MSALLLTLGHNASAIAVDDNQQIVCGYEEERLSGLKSDSRFPINAIDECVRHMGAPDEAYVTHWATDGKLSSMREKYWQPNMLLGLPVKTLTDEFSHHDAHAQAAVNFAGKSFPINRSMVLVIDGFGNFGEHLSIYNLTEAGPKLSVRYYGYGTSLGLMYQYATAYMGMKMHEDEYKLLGYEVHADEATMDVLSREAKKISVRLLNDMRDNPIQRFDPLVRLDALPAVQKYWIDLFDTIGDKHDLPSPVTPEGRIAYAYLVQAILEHTVLALLGGYKPTNLIVSGGVFYNVRLNFWLAQTIPGKVCVFPLAGDQGNALGLYAKHNPTFVMPDTFCWGKRSLKRVGRSDLPANFFVMNESLAGEFARIQLKATGYVNVVRGAMEFGPRALCHTTTFARTTMEAVESINYANGRNTVMPMAPVMSRAMYEASFVNTHKVHKSEQYMVMSLAYKDGVAEEHLGAAHRYPGGYSTGRPQVTDDPFVLNLLDGYGMLINTSFNVHGFPIVNTMLDAVKHHQLQRAKIPAITTIVIQE